jgi:hypothetical protein
MATSSSGKIWRLVRLEVLMVMSLEIQVFWDDYACERIAVTSSTGSSNPNRLLLDSLPLKVRTKQSFRTLVTTYQLIWLNIPKDLNLHSKALLEF